MARIKFNDKKDALLLEFVWKKSKLMKNSMKITDFIDIMDSKYPSFPFQIRNQNEMLQWAERLTILLSNLYKTRDFLFTTKIRMLFATEQPITEDREFLEIVKNHAEILELDAFNRILKFKKDDVELTADYELMEYHQKNMNLLSFVVKKLKNVQHPMSEEEIFKDFSEFKWVSVANRIRFHTITPLIHKFHQLSLDTKIRLTYLLQIPIDIDFYRKIKQTMEVLEIDENFRVVQYKKRKSNVLAPRIENFQKILSAENELKVTSKTTSYKGFLMLLKNLLIFLDSKQLSQPRALVSAEILRLEDTDMKIALKPIGVALEAILEFAIPQTFSIGNSTTIDEFTSRIGFLNVLRSTVMSIDAPEFYGICEKIDELRKKLGDQDQQISMQKIKLGIDVMLISIRLLN